MDLNTAPPVLPALDETPDDFVDSEDFFLDATPEEIEAGNRLGAVIDVEDPTDNGLPDVEVKP